MNCFLFPEKSATPDNIGDKIETRIKDAASTYEKKAELESVTPKKSTVTFPKLKSVGNALYTSADIPNLS